MLENRVEFIDELTKEQNAGKHQALDRQTMDDNGVGSVEKFTKEQNAGELQALQTAAELAATDIRLASRRGTGTGKRGKPHGHGPDFDLKAWQSRRARAVLQASVREQAARDFAPALESETATDEATGELASANDRQASVENRTKLIEKSTTEQIQALETATGQAASDLLSESERQATGDNRLESIGELTHDLVLVDFDDLVF